MSELVQDANDHDGEDQEPQKQGRMCCGDCCDMRRAVIIVNSVSIANKVVAFALLPTILRYGDSELSAALEYSDNKTYKIVQAVAIVFDLVAIAGAVSYNICMVGANIVYMAADFATELYFYVTSAGDAEEYVSSQGDSTSTPVDISQDIEIWVSAFIILCLFVYPHFGFIAEVHAGRRYRVVQCVCRDAVASSHAGYAQSV